MIETDKEIQELNTKAQKYSENINRVLDEIEINDHWKSRKKFSDDCNCLMGNLDQKMLWDFVGFGEVGYKEI